MSMQPLFHARLMPVVGIVVGAVLFGAVTPATADPYTWNGGTGAWDTTTANWLSSSGAVAWPSSGADNDAVFAGTAATVTLSGAIDTNDLLFGTAGYAVQGAGTLTLNGVTPTATVSTGTATIGNATATVLAGSGGLTKSGTGTLLLSPSAAGTLTGGVAVRGGVLAVSLANLATPTNLLPSSNALTLAGGTFSLIEKPGVLASQTFAGLAVGPGLAATSMTRTTGTVTLDLGLVSQQAQGGIVSFQGANTTTAPVRVSNGTNAFIASWAIIGDPRTTSSRWAYVTGSNLVTTVTGSASGTNWANVTSPSLVYTATTSATLAANATAFAVQNNETVNRTVTLGNFNVTTTGLSKLQAFTDTYTSGTGTGSIVVGAGNELVIAGNGGITIAAPIVNGVSGSSAVTYAGGGQLRFDTKASTYTGPTTMTSGTVRIGTGGSINGSSGIRVYGGRFIQANTATAVTPTVTLASGTVDGTGTITTLTVADLPSATVTNGEGTTTALTVGSLTFNGDGTINVNTAGAAGITVTGTLVTTPANGTVTINVPTAPVWTTGSTYNLVGYGAWAGSVSDFTLGSVPGLGARQIATLGTTAATNGFVTLAITGDSLVWTGSGSNLWTTSTSVVDWRLQAAGTPVSFIASDDVRFDDTATGSTTVEISGSSVSPTTTTFANSTLNYVITSGGGFGIAAGSVTKNGSGTVRLDTANTYTGATTINGGTLAVNSGAAIADTSLVTLADAAGATFQVLVSETIGSLSGGGATGGAVAIPTGQTLALSSGTQTYSGSVMGEGTLVNAGATQTINGLVSSSGGVTATTGRLNLGGNNTYTGLTTVAAGAAVVATADGALGATGAGNGTTLAGSGGAVGGVLGFSGVNYTTAERVSGVGVGNTAAVSGLAAVQRGFVQGVSGSSRFAGDIEISGSGVSRIGVQNGALLNLAGAITPAAGVTGVTVLFRAGDTNGDFVILSGTSNAWDTDTAIYSGNNTAGQYAGVRLGVSNALPTNMGVYGSSSAQAATTLDLNGFDQTLSGLTNITQPTGGVAQLRIANLAAGGTSTLTLNVTAARATSLTTLQEVPGGGVLALVKTGTGTQILAGTNTYSGRTTVNAGTLQFNRAGSLYGGTAANWVPSRITVASGATLSLTVGGTTGEFTAADVGTIATNLTTGLNNDGLLAGSFLGLNVTSATTVSTVLADSVGTGGGAVGIVKSGASTLTLDQANTFSGGLRIADGYVVPANNAALGTGTATLGTAAKRLALANGVSLANPIVIDTGAGSGVVANGLIQNANTAPGESATLTGTITVNAAPASGGHFASVGDGSVLTLAGPIVSATTRVTQRAGTVVYAGGGSYPSLDITGTGRLGATNGLATSATISLGLSGAGTLDLAGSSQTLAGLVQSGAFTATVGNGSTTADSILTIVGSSTFAGVIQDTLAAGTRTVGLTLNAPGQRFELSGASTYTGPTAVNAGTLAVNGLLGNSTVTVGSLGALAGSGTIAGNVTVNGLLTPGNSPGVLTLGSLTLGGTTAFELGTGTVRGTDYDGITITTPGGMGYGGTLDLTFSGPVADNTTYDLFSFTGSSTGSFASVTSSGAYPGTWTSIGGGSWQLVSGTQVATFSQGTGDLVIVPEPTTIVAGLATVGLAVVMLRRRRAV